MSSWCAVMFQCSSASRKIGNAAARSRAPAGREFQCSSASRKIGNAPGSDMRLKLIRVSVLFCEPKNRKSAPPKPPSCATSVSVLFCEPKNRKATPVSRSAPLLGSSALLRAEKSESAMPPPVVDRLPEFQCSSASRKIGNYNLTSWRTLWIAFQCSSASRKIGNPPLRKTPRARTRFQCSSASRKIGNGWTQRASLTSQSCFSALLRAEKSEK